MAYPRRKGQYLPINTGPAQKNVRTLPLNRDINLSTKTYKSNSGNALSVPKTISKPVSRETRSKPIIHVKSVKTRFARAPSERVPMTTAYSDQQEQLKYALYSAVTAIQSLINHNTSRKESFTKEKALDRNTNTLATLENQTRPYDQERGIEAIEIPPKNHSRVAFQEQPSIIASEENREANSGSRDLTPVPSHETQVHESTAEPADMKMLVEVKVAFVRIFDIDTVNQVFEAEVYIQARWAESQFSGYSEEQLQEIEFHHCWDPMLIILNNVGSLESDRASMLLRYEPERVYPVLTYMWHVQGVFRETMELEHFPFDVQEIGIAVSTERSIKEIELVCDYTQLSNVSASAMQGNPEWKVYRHVEFTRDYNTSEYLSATKHPVLVAAAHVKRKLGFYFWNVFLIVLIILALSFTVLGIEAHMEERLFISMTLFLTAVAFKLVVKTTLPHISYLTYLDIYVVFALIFLALQAVENSIMIHLKKFRSSAKIELYDEIAQGCLIALLIIFHLVFIIYIQVTAFSRRRSMSDKELDYEITKIHLKKGKQLDKRPLTDVDSQPRNPPQTGDAPPPVDRQEPIEVENPLFRTQ